MFEAILGPKMEPKWTPKIDKKFTLLVKKWVEQPLWPYVSSPPDVFSFVGQICLYLTSRGNGKRSFESAVKMFVSAAILEIC